MPHKHTRRGEDKSTLDLPPTVVAKPLPVSKSANANGIFTTELSNPRKVARRRRVADKKDDTPKAFARIMAFSQGKRLNNGLDDGGRPGKNAKRAKKPTLVEAGPLTSRSNATTSTAAEAPKIRPGEAMFEFSARVDAALPISGLINKSGRGGKDPLGIKVGRTKTERKMHRMYDEWREQDRKLKEQREEEMELQEAEADEEGGGGVKWRIDMEHAHASSSRKGMTKDKQSAKTRGSRLKDDDDPWAVLKHARNEAPARLHDVALAPPQFTKAPRAKFKVRGAAVDTEDVPKTSGSLRRREELGEVRRKVVEGYRQMMKQNSAKSGVYQ